MIVYTMASSYSIYNTVASTVDPRYLAKNLRIENDCSISVFLLEYLYRVFLARIYYVDWQIWVNSEKQSQV